MSKKTELKPIAAAVGAALAASAFVIPAAHAEQNPSSISHCTSRLMNHENFDKFIFCHCFFGGKLK